jgi:hypothetical protein
LILSPTQTHTERAPEDEWLDILPHPVFSPSGDSFMLLAGIQETEFEHFTHIKHITRAKKSHTSVISHGRYEVSQKAESTANWAKKNSPVGHWTDGFLFIFFSFYV